MRKLLATAAEDLLEIVMCRYEHPSTLLTSNRPDEVWQTTGLQRSGHRNARSIAPSRPCTYMWPTQLVPKNGLAATGLGEVKTTDSRPTLVGRV